MNISFLLQYVDFSQDNLEIIKEFFYEQTIQKNELYLKEGDVCNTISFVENGILILSQVSENGDEQILDFFSSGDLVSDYVSFLKSTPADTRIKILKDSSLLTIDKENLNNLYEIMPDFQKLGRLLAEKYLLDFAYLLKTISLPPKKRYEQLISRKPKIFEEVPQYMIASYLGISAEWLSKIRSQL